MSFSKSWGVSLVWILPWVLAGCNNKDSRQSLEVMALDQLYELLDTPTDTTFVINLWATTCKPCMEEMPLLESFGENAKAKS